MRGAAFAGFQYFTVDDENFGRHVYGRLALLRGDNSGIARDAGGETQTGSEQNIHNSFHFVPTSSAETRERITSAERPNGDPRTGTRELAGIRGSVLGPPREVKHANGWGRQRWRREE